MKPLETSYSSVKFFSDRDDVLLVSEEIGLTEELGFCQCELPTSEEYDKPWGIWQFKFRPLLCFAPAVQILYPPNGHIIRGHLCLIMSCCTLAINSRPPQPLVGWLLRERTWHLSFESIPFLEDFERKSSVRKNPKNPNHQNPKWLSITEEIVPVWNRRFLPLKTVYLPDG